MTTTIQGDRHVWFEDETFCGKHKPYPPMDEQPIVDDCFERRMAGACDFTDCKGCEFRYPVSQPECPRCGYPTMEAEG